MQVTQAPGLEAGRAAAASPADTTPPPVLDGVMPRAADAATRPRSAERLANVERLRIVAMLEIVTFHVGGALDTDDYRLPVVAGLGLPVFLLLNNAFNCTLAERRGTRAFLDAKVSRLLLPWLVWSVVYAGVVLAERVRHGEAVVAVFSWRTILGGTYTHLWFVPFALFGSLLIAGLQVETRSASHRRVAWLALAAGSLVVALAALLLALTDAEWPLSAARAAAIRHLLDPSADPAAVPGCAPAICAPRAARRAVVRRLCVAGRGAAAHAAARPGLSRFGREPSGAPPPGGEVGGRRTCSARQRRGASRGEPKGAPVLN